MVKEKRMSDFDRGFVAAESDLNEGWVSIDWTESYIRNMITGVNAGESEEFADGYLAFLNAVPFVKNPFNVVPF